MICFGKIKALYSFRNISLMRRKYGQKRRIRQSEEKADQGKPKKCPSELKQQKSKIKFITKSENMTFFT